MILSNLRVRVINLLTIIGYHHISEKINDSESDKLYISPDRFKEQLNLINSMNIESVSLSDINRKNFKKSNSTYVTLTFDDAYIDFYQNAYPLIIDSEIKSTLFVITDKIGEPNYCTKDMIIEMYKSGIDIGSHTVSHPRLSLLKKEDIYYEVQKSREVLEDLLSVEINSFCYPYGDYNTMTIEAIKKSGYKIGITTEPGRVDLDNCNNLLLNRVAAEYTDNHISFEYKLLNGTYLPVMKE